MITVRLTKNRLPELGRKVRERAIAVINEHAHRVVDAAKQLAPVRTGALRDSITVSESSHGGVRIVVGVPYAGIVEFGSSKQSAQPYLLPALEGDRPDLIRDLGKVIGQ